jgi:hypothetical protein
MFRSLFYDHLQGSSFVLSASTTLRLPAVIYLFGMWPYTVYFYVCPVYLSVGCLFVHEHAEVTVVSLLGSCLRPVSCFLYKYREAL